MEPEENLGIYVGEFENDEMHGNGSFSFPNGSEYIGEFENGLQHGQGLLVLADGTTKMLARWEKGDQVEVEYSMDVTDPEGADDDGAAEGADAAVEDN